MSERPTRPNCRCLNPLTCTCNSTMAQLSVPYPFPAPSPPPWAYSSPQYNYTYSPYHQPFHPAQQYPSLHPPASPSPQPNTGEPSAFRMALGEATNHEPLRFEQYNPAADSRKRSRTRSTRSNKRARLETNENSTTGITASPSSTPNSSSSAHTPAQAVPGVGPPSEPLPRPEATHFGSLVQEAREARRGTEASDVWYFVEGVHSSEKPVPLPAPSDPSPGATSCPDPKKFEWLRCRLCP